MVWCKLTYRILSVGSKEESKKTHCWQRRECSDDASVLARVVVFQVLPGNSKEEGKESYIRRSDRVILMLQRVIILQVKENVKNKSLPGS